MLIMLFVFACPSSGASRKELNNLVEKYRREFSSGEHQKAYETLQAIVRLDPENYDFIFEKGLVHLLGLIENSDKCAAVLFLEEALSKGARYARPVLDALYLGHWSALATLEGSSIAREHLRAELVAAHNRPLRVLNETLSAERLRLVDELAANPSSIICPVREEATDE